MYDPASRHAPNAAFLLPALFAASASEMAAHFAKQFTSLAIGSETGKPPPPQWVTPHRIALQLKTVRLRDFATSSNGPACLLCTPFALHGSTLSDLATGHSLVAALREAGVTNLFVTDWHSASHDMRFLGIDDYLADLNVLVDEIGAPVDLIGLCQRRWTPKLPPQCCRRLPTAPQWKSFGRLSVSATGSSLVTKCSSWGDPER